MVRIPVKSSTVLNPTVELAITALALFDLISGFWGGRFWADGQIQSSTQTNSAPALDDSKPMQPGLHGFMHWLFGAVMISQLFWSPGPGPQPKMDMPL